MITHLALCSLLVFRCTVQTQEGVSAAGANAGSVGAIMALLYPIPVGARLRLC